MPAPGRVDLEQIRGETQESGGGLIVKTNRSSLDEAAGRVQVYSGHGPLAAGEGADTYGRLWSTFQPPTAEARATWDIRWDGRLGAALGISARSRARLVVTVYELDRSTAVARPGPVVFELPIFDEGIGAELQGLAVLTLSDRDRRTVELPPLDPSKIYRIQAEVHCSTYVAASATATTCAFEGGGGMWVDDWYIDFT